MDQAINDSTLMVRLQEGSEAALRDLLDRYQTAVFHFLLQMGCSRQEAEDITQETFIKLYRSAGHYEAKGKFTAFLFKIARNCRLDWLRRQSRRIKNVSMISPDGEMDGTGHHAAVAAQAPLKELGRQELRAVVRQGIDGLSDAHREVFSLSVLQGLRHQDVCDVLDIPVGTVKSRLHHALGQLRSFVSERLGEDWYYEMF